MGATPVFNSHWVIFPPIEAGCNPYKVFAACAGIFKPSAVFTLSLPRFSVSVVVAMVKLHALAFIVCSLTAQVSTSPLHPVSVRDMANQGKRSNDTPIVDLHIVNKKMAPDGYEREYAYLLSSYCENC